MDKDRIAKGVVTKVVLQRGFGFLRDEDGHSRFFHQRFVVDPRAFDRLHEGQVVQFRPMNDAQKGNGLAALEVVVVIERSFQQ